MTPILNIIIPQLLSHLGISGDDAVAFIDAVKAKKLVLGYCREETSNDLRYTTWILGSEKPIRAIIQVGTDGKVGIVRAP